MKLRADHLSSETAKLTQWIDVTYQDIKHLMDMEEKHHVKDKETEETCAICMSELYEGIKKMSQYELESKTTE